MKKIFIALQLFLAFVCASAQVRESDTGTLVLEKNMLLPIPDVVEKMPIASVSMGDKVGVPYDGNLTLEDGKGKWREGYDPRLLYGIDLREYEIVDSVAYTRSSLPKAGFYTRHLDYANWYAKQWALRMMDVAEN